ncbi:MAG TPA: cyanophycinase [Planctomycetota bacterium]|nr:cyanophycinase [Planctomycetota bacterium]
MDLSKPTRLLLCGGGDMPSSALELFGSWAGGAEARVLVIAWASRFPEEAFERTAIALCEQGGAARADASLAPPRTRAARAAFLAALDRATGVFFTGGDQKRIMDGLDDRLARRLRDTFDGGVAFGGTSAGTAIMSPLMIAGTRDPRRHDSSCVVVRPGLGFLPGTIVDQHFFRRRRHNRLFSLLLENERVHGIGIDEGAALAVTGGRGRVLGGQVLEAWAIEGELTVRIHGPEHEIPVGVSAVGTRRALEVS